MIHIISLTFRRNALILLLIRYISGRITIKTGTHNLELFSVHCVVQCDVDVDMTYDE